MLEHPQKAQMNYVYRAENQQSSTVLVANCYASERRRKQLKTKTNRNQNTYTGASLIECQKKIVSLVMEISNN